MGANAQAGANDVLILGSINGTNGATTDTKVGIGLTAPTYPLHVSTSTLSIAARSRNLFVTGTGLLASGEGAAGSYLPAGSGAAFSGSLTGAVFSVSDATGTGIRASGQGITTYPALIGGNK